jgi:heme exporter protein C
MESSLGRRRWLGVARDLAAALGVTGAIVAISLLAPTEETMGHAQRIVYVHVAVAWLGLAGILAAAAGGLLYLLRRDLAWDHRAQAAAEVGWVASSLTLVTGSLWAHEAWGSWWTWDPRLTTALVLWTLYCGYLIVRSAIDDRHRRARAAALLAIVSAIDVPLVVMATRWFRGMHPVAPEMEPAMRVVLAASTASFTVLFAALWARRCRQLHLESRVEMLEQQAPLESTDALAGPRPEPG